MDYFHFNKDCLKINNYILNALNLISYSFVCLFFFLFFFFFCFFGETYNYEIIAFVESKKDT